MNDPFPKDASQDPLPEMRGAPLVFARLLVGLVVLICAEVFSGASLGAGLWNPWTLLVTYWLYFAHFFLLTTLAVRTGRTSLSSLYLWGILYGLYESWITKVIWSGYNADGKFAMGHIGPYGFSEISMVFIYHPVASFILPLAVACLLCPPLRGLFPELAWFTGKSRGARVVQAYLVFSFAPVMAFNSGGPINLMVNLALAITLLLVLVRLAQPALDAPDGRPIVVFGRWGFGGLCVYLAFLYGVGYVVLRPGGRPSVAVQLFTFVFYAFAVAALLLLRRREPLAVAPVEKRELRLVKVLFVVLLALALVISMLGWNPVLFPVIALNFVVWALLGFLLAALAFAQSVREASGTTDTRPKTQKDNDAGERAPAGDGPKTTPER